MRAYAGISITFINFKQIQGHESVKLLKNTHCESLIWVANPFTFTKGLWFCCVVHPMCVRDIYKFAKS